MAVELLSYCQVLGFTLEEQDVIFRIISSILHLGNVYFHRKQLKHGEQTSGFGPFIFVSRLGHEKPAEFSGYSL
jgi:myosin-15